MSLRILDLNGLFRFHSDVLQSYPRYELVRLRAAKRGAARRVGEQMPPRRTSGASKRVGRRAAGTKMRSLCFAGSASIRRWLSNVKKRAGTAERTRSELGVSWPLRSRSLAPPPPGGLPGGGWMQCAG